MARIESDELIVRLQGEIARMEKLDVCNDVKTISLHSAHCHGIRRAIKIVKEAVGIDA